ncbi:MAG: hypothetical protein ACLGPM_01360 [Acidobacteriota bacterium]
MVRFVLLPTIRQISPSRLSGFFRPAILLSSTLGVVLIPALPATAQVLTIDTNGPNGPTVSGAPIERQYQQIQPTQVELSKRPLDTKTRLMLVRALQSEQGFAMRPLPLGHKGLKLEANGKLDPAGQPYVDMVVSNGVSSKPGARVVITNVRFDKNKIIFDLNGGPDPSHRFLRHISVGTDPYDPYDTTPVIQDGNAPVGSRVTLVFKGHVPELTPKQVTDLLEPLISFDVKSPAKAYTDTLPAPLKQAILNHQVLVGMNTEMVAFAVGQPRLKYHEMDGQMPVDIWVFGNPPQPVTFVRINGNRVIRVEIARPGKPVERFDKDVVTAMLQGSGAVEQAQNVRIVKEGDVHRDPNTQAPAPPPSLRNPGEKLPDDQNVGVMKPVHFPKQQPDTTTIGANPDDQPPASAPPAQSKPASGNAQPQPAPPAAGKQGTAPASAPQNPDTADTTHSSN